jgi:hypothetical protein
MERPSLFDRHVLDVVLTIFPALDMWIFVDDQRAEVAAAEHHDVRGAGLRIEVHERADQDAEGQSQVARQDGEPLAGSHSEYILTLVVQSIGVRA